MSKSANQRGRDFELEVEGHLNKLVRQFPALVTLKCQERIKLRDGRVKILDFSIDYILGGTRNRIAIECQDRKLWSTSIIDKIMTIRSQSYRNRFWYIYYDPKFLTADAKKIFEEHGIISFSLEELTAHLDELALSLRGALAAESRRSIEENWKYDPPLDPGVPTPPGGWPRW